MIRFPENESLILEFKRDIPRNNQIAKTIIGFCNTFGGKLVIGVCDDGQIVGVAQETLEDTMEAVEQSIFDACSPTIVPRIYTELFGSKAVLVIEVAEGMNKPYYLRSEGKDNGTYIRLNKHTMPATADYIKELYWKSHGVDYERMALNRATVEDLNLSEIQEFINNRKNKGHAVINDTILQSYGIISYEHSRKHPSVLGILLFGTNPQFFISEAMIICSHFSGVSGRDAIASVDCEGSLFNQYHQAYNFLRQRLFYAFSIKGAKRTEELEVPDVAIREALLNLIVHRNYHIKGPSKIAIYDDRIEFFSPGQFPGPIVVEKMRGGISYLRNPSICKIFREAQYIEKLGSGLITIFNSYEAMKLKEPQIINGEDYVKCILPRVPAEIEQNREDDSNSLLHFIGQRETITVNDVAQRFKTSRATAVRRVNALLASGHLIRVGKGKAVHYKAKSNT